MRTLHPLFAALTFVVIGTLSLAACGDDAKSNANGCGDGQVAVGEECDDGNTQSGDGCSSTCKKEGSGTCGNGSVETGEQCDDGNTQDGDGCSATCQSETTGTCGNGKVEGTEQCDDGNTQNNDGCSSTCRDEAVKEITCQELTALPSGTCAVKEGSASRLVVGTVLTPDTIYRGGQVLLDDAGNIAFVGCKADCEADATCKAQAAAATSITCPQGVISPGLINTHDHILYTADAPYVNTTGERWEHRHDWRRGKNGHTEIPAPGGANTDKISWGELRFLLGGATSTIGSGGATGLLRNLDRTNLEEGLNQSAVDFDVFPLDDSTPPSVYPKAPVCSAFSGIVQASDISADAYLPHVAEGIIDYAPNEFVCLSSENPKSNVVIDKSAFIHGIGLTAPQYRDMATNGTSLIWSPRSNISLYGNTATVTEAARLGVNIALGTDWLPSGSMNVLRELRCADSLNKTYFSKHFTDRNLWMMVTTNAAVATAVDDVIGTLAKGKVGDITIFDGSKHHDYRAIIDADPQDVVLVMRAGKPLYGDEAVIGGFSSTSTCDALNVCARPKKVCLQDEIKKNLSELETKVGNIYDKFFCDTPADEPTCVPSRGASVDGSTTYDGSVSANDSDGDGVPNATDNCPNVFNPVRPMDHGVQADFDGDGAGDACDPCPLDKNTTQCKTFDPNDTDGDGIPNGTDKCPNTPDPEQKDTDGDGKGDACDPCPTAANPGTQGCPSTIYRIKEGTDPVGSTVALANQLVTGRNTSGFFLQIKPGDPSYDAAKGANNSGVFVFSSPNTVNVGDRVTISSATIANYYGQIQLTGPVTTVNTSANETLPAPVVVTPAEVTTNGPKAAALESVIVEVQNVSVTDIAPPLGAGDTAPNNEFVVTSAAGGNLRVNDYLYLITPFPTVNKTFTTLRGILDYRNNDSKLELRDANDVVGGAAVLVGFGPALSFTDVGQTESPTFPTPLTVQISDVQLTNTFVAVTSSAPASLSVKDGGVTIPAGQTSAPVLVSGLAPAQNVTLTATLGGSLQASVRVIGAGEAPSLVSLTPAATTVTPGSTVTLTATLDFPAPAGGTVVDVAVAPANAGTVPATITIPANQLSAQLSYVDASVTGTATVTATLGAIAKSSTITLAANICTNHLVISEIRSRGAGGGDDDFVELYNPTNTPVTLDNTWKLEGRSHSALGGYDVRWTGTNKAIPARGHFLLGGKVYAQAPTADEKLSSGITDATSLRLVHSGVTVDAVCYAFDNATAALLGDASYTCEGATVTNPHNNTTSTNADSSIERKAGGAAGNCVDTNSNVADFLTPMSPANPQNSASPPVP
jgi:large repetitive protein